MEKRKIALVAGGVLSVLVVFAPSLVSGATRKFELVAKRQDLDRPVRFQRGEKALIQYERQNSGRENAIGGPRIV